jgi:hypothetical protein
MSDDSEPQVRVADHLHVSMRKLTLCRLAPGGGTVLMRGRVDAVPEVFLRFYPNRWSFELYFSWVFASLFVLLLTLRAAGSDSPASH